MRLMAFSSRSRCQVACLGVRIEAWMDLGCPLRSNLILSYPICPHEFWSDRYSRWMRTTPSQYKTIQIVHSRLLTVCVYGACSYSMEYSRSRMTAGTLHIRPCSIPSLLVAFVLVPGIGEILWARPGQYGIQEE